MQLNINPTALTPNMLGSAMDRVIKDVAFKDAVMKADPELPPSAYMEANALEAWARTMEWTRVDVVVVLGLGSGLVIDLIRARTRATVLVLEPRAEVVRAVLEHKSFEHENVFLFGDVIPLRTGLRVTSRFGCRVVLVAPPWTRRELADYVPGVEETIRQAHLLTVVNNNTLTTLSHDWLDAMLSVLPSMIGRVPANKLGGALKGVPGVVVAAGPSLDKNIKELKRLVGKAAICAVNTSLKALDAEGIPADLLAVVEHQNITFQVEDSPSLANAALIPGPYAHSGVYELETRTVLPGIFRSGAFGIWLSKTLGVHPLNVGGSVACMAFSVLATMGCDPIILVGQDCAITGRRMYASGTTYGTVALKEVEGGALQFVANDAMKRIGHEANPESKSNPRRRVRISVPAWGGGTVDTIPTLDVFRRWFEEVSAALPSRRLINATEGGAHIEGFEEIALAELCDQLGAPDVDVSKRLASAEAAIPPVDMDTVRNALQGEHRACTKAGKLASRAKNSADKLLGYLKNGRYETPMAQKELKRLEKYETSLRRVSPGALLLDSHVGPVLDEMRRCALQDEAKDLKEATRHSLERSRRIFEEVATVAPVLGPKLDRVIKELGQQGRT